MRTISIFIASSAELSTDRVALQKYLYQKSILWHKEKEIFFELKNWEDFIDAMSGTRLQDEYNKALKGCDIFVMLYWTKVGKYTREEFDTAYDQFKATQKHPLMYVYFNDMPASVTDQVSLGSFNTRLDEIGHFKTVYHNTEHFLLHFNQQLDKIYGVAGPAVKEDLMAMTKEQIYNLINKYDFFQAFEELNKIFKGENDILNALLNEFVDLPNNFAKAQFTMRLKMFVSNRL